MAAGGRTYGVLIVNARVVLALFDYKVNGHAHAQVLIKRLKVVEYVRVFGHAQLLVQARFDLRQKAQAGEE